MFVYRMRMKCDMDQMLLVWLFLVTACCGMSFSYHMFLDPVKKYEMWWKFNDEEITVKLQVQTSGWLGWGLSPNGNMIGSDIMLAWFESDGKGRIQDTHTEGEYRPVADKQQDFHLIEMKKENNKITVVFKRKLLLCNEDDIPITTDTMRVVYAYGDSVQPTYHQLNRGSHSVLLLDYAKSKIAPQLPDDTETFEFRMNDKDALEAEDTLYVCQLFQGPTAHEKHHIIRVEPVIQTGHESLVHHMDLLACDGSVNASHLGIANMCGGGIPIENCSRTLVYAWTIGGTEFDYPDNIGLSYGNHNDPKYFLMQVHYDNPKKISTYKDNSGFRLYYTKQLRKYDAGILAAGLMSRPSSILIPHGEKNFKVTGYCFSNCITSSQLLQPKIFAGSLHTHIHGTKVVTRLVRDSDGVEVKRILQDLNHDFNFQETKHLPNEIEIPPGHSIHVECTYNTEERVAPVTGGLRTRNEMCLAFLLIYPPLPVTTCLSTNLAALGTFQEKELNWTIRYYNRNEGYINQTLVIAGKHYSGDAAWKPLTQPEIWNQNPELAQKWQKAQGLQNFTQYCISSKNVSHYFNGPLQLKLNKTLPVDECDSQKNTSNKGVQHHPLSPSLFIFSLIFPLIFVRNNP